VHDFEPSDKQALGKMKYVFLFALSVCFRGGCERSHGFMQRLLDVMHFGLVGQATELSIPLGHAYFIGVER